LEEVATWKVPNFVKDEAECAEILNCMQSEAPFLKTLFIVRTAASNFPAMRWLSYCPMVLEWDITVDGEFELGAVDRIFLSVTKNIDKQLVGLFPEKDMSRF